MNLNNQKRISAKLLKVGQTKIKFNPERLSDIKEAITKADIRALINDNAITAKPRGSSSRGRKREKMAQKRKGRHKGIGTREGKRTARLSKKKVWMIKTRVQRRFIKELKINKKISSKTYREVYSKIKGNFFRNRSHIKLYLTENKLFENVKK